MKLVSNFITYVLFYSTCACVRCVSSCILDLFDNDNEMYSCTLYEAIIKHVNLRFSSFCILSCDEATAGWVPLNVLMNSI